MAMDEEKKAALLAKLKAGREKFKKAREEAKAKGLPDPKPRKKRASKNGAVDPKEALANPAAAPAANETIAPIDGAPRNAVNDVAAKPVDPTASKSKPIDVPNLPGEGKKVESKADIVKDPEAAPVPPPKKGLSTTGRPEKINDNVMLTTQETGNQAIEVNFPGQKESIKKLLKTNKKENHPEAPAPAPAPKNKTVKQVKEHIPNMDTLEARQPFSFSTVRKLLYQ
jgi:hypothetical protein